ncbi:MAG: ribosome small subunit-dependent GTPase A [Anaerolineales bacterium]|jgi:ribosome biogenesis GTPase
MDIHDDASAEVFKTGVVFRRSQGLYDLRMGDGQEVTCAASSKLRKHMEYWFGSSDRTNVHTSVKSIETNDSVDPVAIGDRVQFRQPEPDSVGMIMQVLPRINELSRMAAGPVPVEQVIVANVDQVILVFSVRNPKPAWNLLDRYLAAAESAGIPALICLTKWDLVRKKDGMDQIAELYQGLGYPVLRTSVVDGQGIEALRQKMSTKLSVLMGKSGVGKTSLLNALEPDLGLRVNEVSQATKKGKHTTSHLELYPFAGGGIVDTPGMREFALWVDDARGGLADLYVEMRPYIGVCRFGLDCSHDHEPDCAVKQAVEAGAISRMRYESYLRLRED